MFLWKYITDHHLPHLSLSLPCCMCANIRIIFLSYFDPLQTCPVLFSHILSCPVLSCVVLSCPILSCAILSYPILSCLVLSCLVLSCLVLSCLVLSCLVLSYPILPCPTSFYPILSCSILSCLILSYPILSCLMPRFSQMVSSCISWSSSLELLSRTSCNQIFVLISKVCFLRYGLGRTQ